MQGTDGCEGDEKAVSCSFHGSGCAEAIREALTLVELGDKHGIHHTMIVA